MLHAANGVAGKVMRANEKWILMEDLRARWFIVGVIQSYERIAQERRQFTAGLRYLFRRAWRGDDLRQVCAHLQFGVAIVVDSLRPFIAFAIAEDGPRHLEFAQVAGQGKHPLLVLAHPLDAMQSIAKFDHGVERDQ